MAKVMKTKKESLRTMSRGELSKKLATLEESLRANRFVASGSKSKNVKESREQRKEVARILTVMNAQHAK